MWLNVPDRINTESDSVSIAGFCSGTGMLEYAVQASLEQRGYRAATMVHVGGISCIRHFV